MGDETKDESTSTNTNDEVKNVKLGPKVLSNIWLEDKDFEIKNGEMKELPADYEQRPAIVKCIKDGRIKILEEIKEKGKEITLDGKDVSNFLNQNTRTVIKQLKINELSKTDLNKLLIAEKKNKQRKNIVIFIQTLLKVG